ncbi:DUF1636 family protein [Nitratireductor sp. ZSWI3]|uniref:DUF1636 family protein n=1 Tax=Nitratireductor sp. ZSWI3 TaxID=2966359 RepID=UPI00214FA8EE|nr:DUF1636 family protein [Nitratireductor sp. ZSWI3]MCR4269364.1 DUF1636 family protein [Nitratireductor sp. ZSWI3]
MTINSAVVRDPPTDCGKPDSGESGDRPDAEDGVTVIVCSSCRRPGETDVLPRPGSLLAADTARAARESGINVKHVACLGNCKRGLSAAILKPGAWSYVFGELAVDSGADLVAGAELFAGSTDGFMPFRARPEKLKRGLIARIPTFDNLKDLP